MEHHYGAMKIYIVSCMFSLVIAWDIATCSNPPFEIFEFEKYPLIWRGQSSPAFYSVDWFNPPRYTNPVQDLRKKVKPYSGQLFAPVCFSRSKRLYSAGKRWPNQLQLFAPVQIEDMHLNQLDTKSDVQISRYAWIHGGKN